jgi:hypothetical protein
MIVKPHAVHVTIILSAILQQYVNVDLKLYHNNPYLTISKYLNILVQEITRRKQYVLRFWLQILKDFSFIHNSNFEQI